MACIPDYELARLKYEASLVRLAEASGQTIREIPTELVPKVRELIAKHKVA